MALLTAMTYLNFMREPDILYITGVPFYLVSGTTYQLLSGYLTRKPLSYLNS